MIWTTRRNDCTPMPASMQQNAEPNSNLPLRLPAARDGPRGQGRATLLSCAPAQVHFRCRPRLHDPGALGTREITFNGQVFLPGRPSDTRLYATYFCRECGQEHHPVTLIRNDGTLTFLARSIDEIAREASEADGSHTAEPGFITPVTNDDMASFKGDVDDYPDDWIETTKKGVRRLKASYRECEQAKYRVAPDGSAATSGQTVWFQRGKFRLCAACGEAHAQSGRDINRLAGLTAEGRSSATTVLINSVLRWMKDPDHQKAQLRQKVLGL